MTAAIVERVQRVGRACSSDPGARRSALTAALADLARIESWAAARRAELVRKLNAVPGSFPEADVADANGSTLGAAAKETDRARTLERAEAFADALDAGSIRPGHVDALTRAAKDLNEEQRAALYGQQESLATVASSSSISAFDKHVRARARALQSEADAEARLQRQRRNTRLRHWTDAEDGMWCLSGRFDPLTGRNLARLLDDTVDALFAEQTPDTAPTDPLAKQQHLNALAMVRLLQGDTPSGRRPGDPIVVVDATSADAVKTADDVGTPTAGAAGQGLQLDWGLPVELPMSVLREIFDVHDPDVVIVANGIVLHAPGRLNLGRTTWLANRAQRRALRGLYATCAVPGCAVHYDRCRLHHVIWWELVGRTDLDNLLPVCAHHHTRLHLDGWEVSLGPNRELTITLPSGQIMSTGPPNRRAA